jgi:hypothetical protein
MREAMFRGVRDRRLDEYLFHPKELRAGVDPGEGSLEFLSCQRLELGGEHGVDYGLAATSLTVAATPILILYVFMSERFVEVLTAGGIKG